MADWRYYWRTWQDSDGFAHPDAPIGGAGPGYSRPPMPDDWHDFHFEVPHPDSPEGRTYDYRTELPRIDMLERLRAVLAAMDIATDLAPEAIRKATGEELHGLIHGMLEGLLILLAAMGVITLGGAAAGAALGTLLFGVGAAPGAIVGAEMGFEFSMWLLEWVGLAALTYYIGTALIDAKAKAMHAIEIAWNAPGSLTDIEQIHIAGEELAEAVGLVFQALLEGIVAWLLAEGAAKAAERVPEMVSMLKRSKLGEAFGAWVERNWRGLVENPRLRPKGRGREVLEEEVGVSRAGEPVEELVGKKLAAREDGALHNQEWDRVEVEDFQARRREGPVDMDNLTLEDQEVQWRLKQKGIAKQKIQDLLDSGYDFEATGLKAGQRLYKFTSRGYQDPRIAESFYWLDEAGVEDVMGRYYRKGVWDRQGIKEYLALPCYNRADELVYGTVNEDSTGMKSVISPATENVTYMRDGEHINKALSLPGGGTQVTPEPGTIRMGQ